MTALSRSARPIADQASFLTFEDREAARTTVHDHLTGKRPIEELGIEPNRPVDLQDFAYVGRAPKRSSQLNWYRCSFCETDRKFAQGRIVLSSDGRLRLIGDDCWDKHLDPERHQEELRDWKEYQIKKGFDRIRGLLGPEVAKQAYALRVCLSNGSSVFSDLQLVVELVRKEAPLLFECLKAAHERGGILQTDRRVRDYSAEQRSDSPRFITISETVHVLRGLEAIIAVAPNLEQACEETLGLLYKIKSFLEGGRWEAATNREAVRLIKSVERDVAAAVRTFHPVRSAVQSAEGFFSRDNLSGLVHWSHNHDCELLELIPEGIRFISAQGEITSLEKPAGLNKFLLPNLQSISRILDIE